MAKTRLRPPSNIEILDAIRTNASIDYKNRVPAATKAGVQKVLDSLQANPSLWNELIPALINKVGTTHLKTKRWESPAAKFKRADLKMGQTIEEVILGLVKAKDYSGNRSEGEGVLFGRKDIDVRAIYHHVNRRDRYDLTVDRLNVQRAMLDEGGLDRFIAAQFDALHNSDQLDEFNLMVNLIPEYEARGGFFRKKVPDLTTLDATAEDSRAFLKTVRAFADELRFISTKYNAAGVPTFAKPEDLVLITTPRVKANIDVEALAAAFNIEFANIDDNIFIIPEGAFKIEGAQAVLTTRDFFVVADQLLETTSMPNPAGLYENFFLHHHGVISASLFETAILFSSIEDDEVDAVENTVSSVDSIILTDREGESVTTLKRGDYGQLSATWTTTPADVEPAEVLYVVSGHDGKTFVDNTGILHIGTDEKSDSITITAIATWRDSTDVQGELKRKDLTVTVTGDREVTWPRVSPTAETPQEPEEDTDPE